MSTNSNKWLERLITLAAIILSSFSGYLIDKTRMEDKMAIVEKKVLKIENELKDANLGLILYRIDEMKFTVSEMKTKVDNLDDKIDASTDRIINSLNNRRR